MEMSLCRGVCACAREFAHRCVVTWGCARMEQEAAVPSPADPRDLCAPGPVPAPACLPELSLGASLAQENETEGAWAGLGGYPQMPAASPANQGPHTQGLGDPQTQQGRANLQLLGSSLVKEEDVDAQALPSSGAGLRGQLVRSTVLGCVRVSVSTAWVAPEVPHVAGPVPSAEEVVPSPVLDLSSWGDVSWTLRDQPFREKVVGLVSPLPFCLEQM